MGFGRPRTRLSSSSRARPVALWSCDSIRCSSDFLLCSGGCKRTYIVAKTAKENRTVVPSGSPTPLCRELVGGFFVEEVVGRVTHERLITDVCWRGTAR